MNKDHTFVVLAYKESPYLESCINSVIRQNNNSHIVIATSTPCTYISDIAEKYNLKVYVNSNPGKGIGYDFDFAISCGKTKLVTVAHQDDIYEDKYGEKVIQAYKKNPNSLIIFSDYYEIREEEKVSSNSNLKIKRVLLFPIRFRFFGKLKFGKRWILRFGNSICCPAVTFVKENIQTEDIFKCDFKCNVDWYAWEKLSLKKGQFIFLKALLMGHRVHEDSTTSEIIKDRIRTKEDLEMFNKFWPKFISKLLNKFYIKSEESNS